MRYRAIISTEHEDPEDLSPTMLKEGSYEDVLALDYRAPDDHWAAVWARAAFFERDYTQDGSVYAVWRHDGGGAFTRID